MTTTMTIRPGVLLPMAACLLLGPTGTAARLQAQTGDDLSLGKKVYEKTCAECHGRTGRGDGPTARRLGFTPRDFTLGAFKCRCTPTGQLPTDEDLFRTVTNGLLGTPMLRHDRTLTEQERRAVVRFIKTFSPKFNDGNAASCGPSPKPPPASVELIAEGRQVYRLMQCAKCHGATGKGDGPAAATLKDDWGRPITPHNFVVTGSFKCGNGEADLYRTLRTGLTGTPMPSYDAALGFSRDDFNSERLQNLGSPADVEEVRQYLRRQPERAALEAMSDQSRQELSSRRTWALVQFLKSLLVR